MKTSPVRSKGFKRDSASSNCARVLLCCIIAAIALVASGCINKTDAHKLSDSGLSLANSLAAYYDTLGQQIDDLVEMEAFNDALRELPVADFRTYADEMEQTKEALQRRSRLARQLAATYKSLADLSSYDASGEVSSSFSGLGQALTGIPPLKSLSASATANVPADPTQLLSKGASLLASWKQSRDMGKAVKGVTDTLDGLDRLFGRELPACQSISAEHAEKTGVLASELIETKQVVAWQLLEQDLEGMGLKLVHPNQPPTDQALAGALAAVVQARAIRSQTATNLAGQSLLDAMNRQLTAQRRFQAKQEIRVSDIQAVVENANAFLDEVVKQSQSTKH